MKVNRSEPPAVAGGCGGEGVGTIRVSEWVDDSTQLELLTHLLTQEVLTCHYSRMIRARLPRRKSPFNALRVSTTSGACSITRA